MRLAMIGTGYVGLVSGACFSHIGHQVSCIDVDAGKIAQLQKGQVPLHEQGLEDIVVSGIERGLLSFTTDMAEGLRGAQVVFIAVGTPASAGGGADLSHVMAAARSIARYLENDATIVVKSTVPLGGNERVFALIREQLEARFQTAEATTAMPQVSLASNPEFLREGLAVEDFMQPDRVVIGCNEAADSPARARLAGVYEPLAQRGVDLQKTLLWTDLRSAELIKYASNAMLAARISFMNEMAAIAQACGADIEEVRRGMGADHRIGREFLRAGIGYGGSCFPKDVRALAQTAREHGITPRLLDAVHNVNEAQKELLFERIAAFYAREGAVDIANEKRAPEGELSGLLAGRTIAVWGLAFKPGTDDLREAPSLPLLRALLAAGATVRACDPAACERTRAAFSAEQGLPANLSLSDDPLEAIDGADALAIVTEWPEFNEFNAQQLAQHLKDKVVFDGRNLLNPATAEAAGLRYFGIGRGAIVPVTAPVAPPETVLAA